MEFTKNKLWAKVISIKDNSALGVTADGKYVLIPVRAFGAESLLIGDFISFVPEPPTPRVAKILREGKPDISIDYHARNPWIESRSMRAWKDLLILIRPRTRAPLPWEIQESSITAEGNQESPKQPETLGCNGVEGFQLQEK
jgi:hypothetical protein